VSTCDAVIFGRRSGPSSTSITEALLCSVRQGLTLLHQQVVRPRRRRSGWRIRSFAGSMLSSNLASNLDGIVSRSPTMGGGGAQGPDRVSNFCLRVLAVKSGGPFFKSGFFCAIDAIGPPCKLYPPRVI
jgi:hypothetical protein